MIYQQVGEVQKGMAGILKIAGEQVEINDGTGLRERAVDDLIHTAVFSDDEAMRTAARWLIRRAGAAAGVLSASIQPLYEAMGRGEAKGFTVPAINIRALTYHTAQAVLRAAMKLDVGPVIFEIARSEIDYTRQRPTEYIAAVTAALKEYTTYSAETLSPPSPPRPSRSVIGGRCFSRGIISRSMRGNTPKTPSRRSRR